MLCFSSRPEPLCHFSLSGTDSVEQCLCSPRCGALLPSGGRDCLCLGNSFLLQVSQQVSSLLDHLALSRAPIESLNFHCCFLERCITWCFYFYPLP